MNILKLFHNKTGRGRINPPPAKDINLISDHLMKNSLYNEHFVHKNKFSDIYPHLEIETWVLYLRYIVKCTR